MPDNIRIVMIFYCRDGKVRARRRAREFVLRQGERRRLSYCGIVKPFNTIAQIKAALIAGTGKCGRGVGREDLFRDEASFAVNTLAVL